jgi:phenol 2-monooxygenase
MRTYSLPKNYGASVCLDNGQRVGRQPSSTHSHPFSASSVLVHFGSSSSSPIDMAPSLWSFMKHSVTSPTSHHDQQDHYRTAKMAADLSSNSSRSTSFEHVTIPTSTSASLAVVTRDKDYSSFLSDVLVVGAGPAGLMLADNLVRFGIKTKIIDNRSERTATGRADGLQPKSIETLRQMRLAEPLLRKGVKVYDIAFWKSTAQQPMHRIARDVHYPPVVDLLDPYLILVHQGMIEAIFEDDLLERGVRVTRDTTFVDIEHTPSNIRPLKVRCNQSVNPNQRSFGTRYVVGCDGAHSQVRKSIPGATPVGASSESVWGVIDGVLDTNFPDLWSKVAVQSEELGSILIIPRERNLTRMYIELRWSSEEATLKERQTQELVQKRACEIMHPYRLNWKSVEWFGRYQVGQRVAARFTDPDHRVFIAGDASHTHSPKAAQGMNTSIHDTWNLAWKLNFVVRDLAKPTLINTYEQERKKVGQDLINFDFEHANAFAVGDPKALAANFTKNVAFISGYGVHYDENVLNVHSKGYNRGFLKPGFLLPPAKVTRFIDANPVDIQTDIPALGQFRIYFFTKNVYGSMPFLETVTNAQTSNSTYVGRITQAANASYTVQPPLAAPHDQFVCPERYTPVSGVFTYALVTGARGILEMNHLPPVLRESIWTFYLDDVPEMDTRKQSCVDKWLDGLADDEVVVVNVRPDGYVGTVRRWADGSRESGQSAVVWMDNYYSKFMRDS